MRVACIGGQHADLDGASGSVAETITSHTAGPLPTPKTRQSGPMSGRRWHVASTGWRHTHGRRRLCRAHQIEIFEHPSFPSRHPFIGEPGAGGALLGLI
jgi:hypothetical protein